MGQIDELKDRVEAKKLRLQANIKELQADTRSTSREEAQKLQSKLDALTDSVKDGWDNITDAVAGKLNSWLKDD
jgi:ElaB/YqjD/DUF883 family membrane-anchored ribosome-binding protein